MVWASRAVDEAIDHPDDHFPENDDGEQPESFRERLGGDGKVDLNTNTN